MLFSRPDRRFTRWCRRALYTPENYAAWVAWSRPLSPHRDRLKSGDVFIDAQKILTQPNLRSAHVEKAADAWHAYRRPLIILISQALTVGFPWTDILARLSSVLSDPEHGYQRIDNYITSALEDPVLLAYPLLHADVLIYKLDCSYAVGTYKYAADSVSVDWESATSRRPGEGPIDLAVRVTNAFVMMHDNESITNVTVWSTSSYVNKINTRYAECLGNDIAYPERGASSMRIFLLEWERTRARVEKDRTISVIELSCEYIAGMAAIEPVDTQSLRGDTISLTI